MAKPPEPIAEVMPHATLVVEAVVAQVLSTGPRPAPPEKPHASGEFASDRGILSPAQTLTLEIMRTLKGAHDSKTITVEKPPAGYSLLPGNKGPFLLDTTVTPAKILGRYGPDTWPLARVEAAITAG